jgi:hypothetical protein
MEGKRIVRDADRERRRVLLLVLLAVLAGVVFTAGFWLIAIAE